MKLKLGLRIWILLIVLLLALIAISPKTDISGIIIKNPGAIGQEQGLQVGEKILEINNIPVETVAAFGDTLKKETKIDPIKVILVTDKSTITYNTFGDFNFTLNNDLTVKESFVKGLDKGVKLESINGKSLNSTEDFEVLRYDILPTKRLEIKTDKKTAIFLVTQTPDIEVEKPTRTNIKKGLDLGGGTRILLQPASNEAVSDKDIQDIIAVMNNKINVYGLADVKLRAANDLSGNKYILVEIAGATRSDIEDFLIKQGKFEAKIGDDLIFEGGRKNIPSVCRNDGTCSGIRSCNPVAEGYQCQFQFSIKLSPESAQRHADVTSKIPVITSDTGQRYLEKQIDFYLDGSLVDSLNIAEDLRGQPTTDILISGPGVGNAQQTAYEDALSNMDKLQTVLISGSLPYKLDIVKVDTVSPTAGSEFVTNAIKVGLIAALAVLAVIYIRYRKLKILFAMAITLFSEIFIIIGAAAAINWSLDLAAIAGIVASVGTGIDDQIIITDEVMKGQKEHFFSWKEKIKRAFSIILVSFFTTTVAMIPLFWAGAGLLRGFAVTTIIGITIGVFITRPAFAAVLEKLNK